MLLAGVRQDGGVLYLHDLKTDVKDYAYASQKRQSAGRSRWLTSKSGW